jgi:hypothetical protein
VGKDQKKIHFKSRGMYKYEDYSPIQGKRVS